jgi:hypothetical protein
MLIKLSGFILGALLIFGTAASAKADDYCARRIRHDRYELNHAIRHHGYDSWEARHARRNLDRALDECRAR